MQSHVAALTHICKRGFFAEVDWQEEGLAAVMMAMGQVDRALYSPCGYQHACPVIGRNMLGPVTMSKPVVHAFFLHELWRWLRGKSGAVNVLDVGSGTGFLTVCLARLMQHCVEGAHSVIGIEVTDELAKLGHENWKSDPNNASMNIEFRTENACRGGPGEFDFICVSAAGRSPGAVDGAAQTWWAFAGPSTRW